MTDEHNKNKLAKIRKENPGLLTGLSRTMRLVLRLIADKRVNFFLKLLPISTLIYLVSPLDAAIPAVDDAFVIGLGTYVFIELCPQDVVEEHQARLAGITPDTNPADSEDPVIDTSFTEDK
ncbi:MAG: YkvA family protein [Anaerolineales bacterium]